MDQKHPRVSVGMPVFNGDRFLAEALESALAQTFTDFELIVSDNGSTDRTEQICRSYATRDTRIRYCRNEVNRGAAWNHNRVVELARGEYFKWWSHDDLCAPGLLGACVSVMDSDPGIILCSAQTQIIDAEGQLMQRYFNPLSRMSSPEPHNRFCDAVIHNHMCYELYGVTRTEVLRKTPLIASYTGSDRILVADLALRGRFYELPGILFFNREHPARSTRAYSLYEVAGWFDPKLEGKITFVHWRYLLEYGRTINRSGLSFEERMRCYCKLPSWINRNRERLVADLRVATKVVLHRLSPTLADFAIRIHRKGPRALFGTARRMGQENTRPRA